MMAEQKTLGAGGAAPEGAGRSIDTHRRYILPHHTVNPWCKVDAVAERVVDRLPRSTS